MSNIYIRKIKSMGYGLVAIEIKVKNDILGLKYHILYNNGYKPPLDLAFDHVNQYLYSMSYIIQDEKISIYNFSPQIKECDLKYEIPKDINEKNYLCDKYGVFRCILVKSDLWILMDEVEKAVLYEFQVNDIFSLLFRDSFFCGCLIKNLTINELNELKKSGCL